MGHHDCVSVRPWLADGRRAALVAGRPWPAAAQPDGMVARRGAAGVRVGRARRARDRRRFLDGETTTGLAYLGAFVVCVLAGGWATRVTFLRLATIVEPLRDALVVRTVEGSLGLAAASGGVGSSAVARLTGQVEIVREAYASVLLGRWPTSASSYHHTSPRFMRGRRGRVRCGVRRRRRSRHGRARADPPTGRTAARRGQPRWRLGPRWGYAGAGVCRDGLRWAC